MSVIERDLIESQEKEKMSIGINNNPIWIPLLQNSDSFSSHFKDEGFITFL